MKQNLFLSLRFAYIHENQINDESIEERSVRDNAIESVKNIISLSTVETFNNQYAAMISRLATKEWFTARISACTLIAASLELLPPDNQVSLLQYVYFYPGISNEELLSFVII